MCQHKITLAQTICNQKRYCITSRLCDEGYEISKIPSDAEIEDARRKYALKKEVSDIDQSLILTNGKRRLDEQTGSSGDDKILKEARASGEPAPAVIPNENEEVRSASKKMKLSQDTGEDEEAEAQF